MAQKVEKFKRKTHIERTGPAWRSESISSEEESLQFPAGEESQINRPHGVGVGKRNR